MSGHLAEFLGVARAGRVLNDVLRLVTASARPGVTVGEVDRLARVHLARAGARSAMLGYTDDLANAPFLLALALSLNDEITGASDPARIIRPGDLATADLAIERVGWHADAAVSWVIPGADRPDRLRLARASCAVTTAGVRAIRPGTAWDAVVGSMAAEAGRWGVSLLRGFDGHAVGRSMHAPPRLPTHPDEVHRFPTVRLEPGMVFTVEPVVGFRDPGCRRSGWLDRTADGSDACFTEVTVAMGGGKRARRADARVLAGFLDPISCMT